MESGKKRNAKRIKNDKVGRRKKQKEKEKKTIRKK